MVYLVTNRDDVPYSDKYEVISVDRSLEILEPIRIVGFDTETNGLSPFLSKLLLMQLGNKDAQVVVDVETVDVQLYKPYLESDRLFLLWNAKFDLRFLFYNHIDIKLGHVFDGMLAEQLLYLGYPDNLDITPDEYRMGGYDFPYIDYVTKAKVNKRKISYSLKAAGNKYLSVEFDKSIRDHIADEPLSEDVIIYSANDVKYLEDIYNIQLEKLKEKGLLKAVEYENRFVIVLAYIEWSGVKIDRDKWLKKSQEDFVEADGKLQAINNWVTKHFDDGSPFVSVEYDDTIDDPLIKDFYKVKKCTINWNSPKQVIPLFKALGVDVSTIDKKTKEEKESVSADLLKGQRDQCELIDMYIEYKEAVKVTGTYGVKFFDQIESDGRIHTNFKQLLSTGRLSSGGSDKVGKKEIKHLNLQNLPANARTRSCFVSEEGNKWISADYSGQESRLIASIANDKAMIELFTTGCGDVHSLAAKMSYPDIIGDCPVEEIKSKFKHYRNEAKGIEFAINYGGSAITIAKGKQIPLKDAQKIYDDYMKGFSGIAKYQQEQRKFVMKNGYILINPLTGHKVFVHDYKKLKLTESKFNEVFWSKYRTLKSTDKNHPIVLEVKNYFKRKSDLEKEAINYRIQGTGALCFKLFSIYLYDWIVKSGYLYKVKYCVPVHDEANIEAPDDIAEEAASKLIECMEKAGNYFCDKVYMKADLSRGEDGELPTYWIH